MYRTACLFSAAKTVAKGLECELDTAASEFVPPMPGFVREPKPFLGREIAPRDAFALVLHHIRAWLGKPVVPADHRQGAGGASVVVSHVRHLVKGAGTTRGLIRRDPCGGAMPWTCTHTIFMPSSRLRRNASSRLY